MEHLAENPFFDDDEDDEKQSIGLPSASLPGAKEGGLPSVPVSHLSTGDLPGPALPSGLPEVPRTPHEMNGRAGQERRPGSSGGLPPASGGVAKKPARRPSGRPGGSLRLPETGDEVLDAPVAPVFSEAREPVVDSGGSEDEVGLTMESLLASYADEADEEPEGEDAFADNADDAVLGDALSSFLDDEDEDEDDDEDEDFYAMYNEDDTAEEDFFAGFDIDAVIADAIDARASDVHVSANDTVAFTILGEISKQPQYGVPSGTTIMRVQQAIVSNVAGSAFVENLELDTSYVLRSGRYKGQRTRLNVVKSFDEIAMTFRVIVDQIPSPEDLGVPPEMVEWVKLPSGLFLLNGSTGSGKTTTIASLLRRIQMTRPQKIITLEKPIEFIYGTDGKAFITQREVGRDCRSFGAGLTSAMRQAPDIILVGEVRDRSEVDELLRAAETGHLAISTIHADSVVTCINRIKSLYDGDEQRRVMGSLGGMTRGMANQVLLKSADGKSRFACHEVLTFTPEVSHMVTDGDDRGVRQYQEKNGFTMEHALVKAVREGRCTRETAESKAPFPFFFNELMGDMGVGSG